jgi:hypothetical protein
MAILGYKNEKSPLTEGSMGIYFKAHALRLLMPMIAAFVACAQNRNRTCTPLRKPDFESGDYWFHMN